MDAGPTYAMNTENEYDTIAENVGQIQQQIYIQVTIPDIDMKVSLKNIQI